MRMRDDPDVLFSSSFVTFPQHHLVLVGWYVWVGPVPGLKVAPESFQVHRREVWSDTFSQPPLALCCASAARLAELVFEVFSTHPPEKEGDTGKSQ